jgi:hypothetical protein
MEQEQEKELGLINLSSVQELIRGWAKHSEDFVRELKDVHCPRGCKICLWMHPRQKLLEFEAVAPIPRVLVWMALMTSVVAWQRFAVTKKACLGSEASKISNQMRPWLKRQEPPLPVKALTVEALMQRSSQKLKQEGPVLVSTAHDALA